MGILLDHAQDQIFLLDGEGRITYANAAVERIVGYDRRKLIGESAFEYIHPDDIERVRTAFEETISSETFTQSTVEHRSRAADGTWTWLESRMSNLTDEALEGYVVSSRDITDRVVAQREQHATSTRLEELAAVTGDVLWLFSGDWSEVLFVNPAYEEVYGRPVEELLGDPASFMGTVHPDDREKVEEGMDQLAAGTSVDMEYRVNPDRDFCVWVWVQAEPIVVDGEVVRISGFTRDITDRRRRERQLVVMDNLLRHNLRNDLSTILGNASLIEEEVPETAEEVAVIRQTGQELLATAGKQRELIEILSSDATPTRFDLIEAIESSVDILLDRFPEATVDRNSTPSAEVQALVELEMAIVELLENAVRYSDAAEPTVRITVQRTDGGVRFVVEDDGPPIPDIEARVLTGDYEMDDLYHSSGLGLWLVYWIVELSEGTVSIGRSETGGNRIVVELPGGSS